MYKSRTKPTEETKEMLKYIYLSDFEDYTRLLRTREFMPDLSKSWWENYKELSKIMNYPLVQKEIDQLNKFKRKLDVMLSFGQMPEPKDYD